MTNQDLGDQSDINPFVGPRAYQKDDGAMFKGRATEVEDIGYQVLGASVCLVYGDSGIGKTSLVQAGLTHWLEKHEITLDCESCAAFDANTVRQDIKDTLRYYSPEGKQRGAICFDGFERVFDRTGSDKDTRVFFDELSALIQRIPHTAVLLVMRSEWLAHLERYEWLLPDQLEDRYRIDPLSEVEASKMIVDVSKSPNSSHPFDPDAADWLVD